MKYETLMKTLITAIQGSLPMAPENYERLAREFDTERREYFDNRPVPSATGGIDGEQQSPHELYHPNCFNTALKAAKTLRDPTKMHESYRADGLGLVAMIEDHCIQLVHPGQHNLTSMQALTNRATWQGANALISMALALRPKSSEWMEVVGSWNRGVSAVVTCTAALRIRRRHPAELAFTDPAMEMHPMEFVDRMMSFQGETAQIISSLFAP